MTDFTAQNDLERLLVEAAADVGARPAFYRAFLDCTLLVICNVQNQQLDSGEEAVVTLEDVQSIVQMQDSEGNFVIPVFSSLARLKETHAGRVAVLRLTGRRLLDLLGSSKPIVLNPMSDYGKEFTPRELAALHDGSMFQEPEHQSYAPDVVAEPGLPAGYPDALLDALNSLFARNPGVTRAYLASIRSRGSTVPAHPVVAFDLTDNWFDIVRDAGVVAGQILGEGQYVDFLPLRDGDALSEYILQNVGPFYVSN